ncbi:hypothetical protein ACPF8X_07785 [Streptomyces sp. G35A]
MSVPHLARREDQQRIEWIGGSVFGVLLDAEATGGQLTVGRFDVSKGGGAAVPRAQQRGRGLPAPGRFGGGFRIPAQVLAEAAELSGNVVLVPPRRRHRGPATGKEP